MTNAVEDDGAAERQIAAVRRFNRFYTRRIGALDEGHLHSPFSLAEVRVLYEIAHGQWGAAGSGGPIAAGPTAAAVRRALGLDAGYLSRMLAALARRGLVERAASPSDGRQHHLRLTDAGRTAFADLDARARADVAALLAPVGPAGQRRLLDALRTIEAVLGAPAGPAAVAAAATPPFVLRPPRPGDLGWVVARHGALYDAEYGWDARFEALVARIVADFVDGQDPARERCWIAEHGGESVGSVFLVRHPEREGVAKLRLLLVEPSARGLGVGRALVDACTAFARESGYHTVTLWTNSVLLAARRLYAAAGYRLLSEERHHSFGRELTAEVWELAL